MAFLVEVYIQQHVVDVAVEEEDDVHASMGSFPKKKKKIFRVVHSVFIPFIHSRFPTNNS